MGRSRGKTYELRARFSAEADVSGVEKLENRIAVLTKRLDKLDGKGAKVRVSSEQIDKLEETTESTVENLDEIGSRKKRKPRIDSSELDDAAAKVERITKLVRTLEKTKVSPDVDSGRLDMLTKKLKSAKRESFDVEIHAKLVGDDNMRRQAQRLQSDINKTLANTDFVKTYQQAQEEMRKAMARRIKADTAEQQSFQNMYQKAQVEMRKAFQKRMDEERASTAKGAAEREKAYREMEKDFIKRSKAVKQEIQSIDAALSNALAKQTQMELTLDASQALTQARSLSGTLRGLMDKAYKVSITADNADLKAKATESYRILQTLNNQVANAKVRLQNEVELTKVLREFAEILPNYQLGHGNLS